MIFVITEICLYNHRYKFSSEKEQVNESHQYTVYSLAPGLDSDPPIGSDREWGCDTMVVELVAVQYRILEYMEMMNTALMKKLMMNLMNLMETRMFKLMDMYHSSRFSTKF